MSQDVEFPWEDVDATSQPAEPPTEDVTASAEAPATPAEPPTAPPEAPTNAAESAHEPVREVPRQRPIARKEYYSIGEVSDLVGLPAHVLRYWETQFSVLNPSKNRSGNRAYQRKEIRLILLVKQLLYEDKYTVEGAKIKLEQLRKGGGLAHASAGALDKELMELLRQDIAALRHVLAGTGA
jgi:DNA-binding transcriptional MerR regulator